MRDLTSDGEMGHHGHEMHSSEMHGNSTFSITLKIYPTEAFMKTYRTNNPLIATIIIVCMMFILTVVFCMYDWYVRNEFHFKNELLEAKRNFIRFVSHEVRSPLNAVCMGLMLVREELDKAMKDVNKRSIAANNKPHQSFTHTRLSEWKSISDEILENSQNAVDVLNDLLNYDKITTGSLKLELSLLEIGMLMDHSKREFKLPAAKKNIRVAFEDNAKLPYRRGSLCIVGDDVRLIQVLRNLMSNAFKFTPREGKLMLDDCCSALFHRNLIAYLTFLLFVCRKSNGITFMGSGAPLYKQKEQSREKKNFLCGWVKDRTPIYTEKRRENILRSFWVRPSDRR